MTSAAPVLVLALLAMGCASPAPVEETPQVAGRETAAPLPQGEWRRGDLRCEVGACVRWHRVSLDAPGELLVEVHAASGPDVPDFDVRLEDDAGEVLWGFAPTGHTPRKIERVLTPGDYYLVVESIGELQGPLEYETLARTTAAGPVFRAQESSDGKPRRQRRMPRRPEIWMNAEIFQVEGRAGLPGLVVLDGGSLDDWQLGHRGELLEGGAVIATFVLIEVGESRSRGRLDGAPTDSITYETRARVRIPLE